MALIGFGPVEAIVVVIVVLVVFGAGRLAGVGKALGTGLREFREEARTSDSDGDESEDDDSDGASDEATVSSSSEDEDKRSSSG
jgi:sec-independent protein translocase protein TatA